MDYIDMIRLAILVVAVPTVHYLCFLMILKKQNDSHFAFQLAWFPTIITIFGAIWIAAVWCKNCL